MRFLLWLWAALGGESGQGEVAAGGAPPGDAKPADGKPEEKGGSDILDVILEGMKEPTKIPLEKVQPQLAKFRADADRKLSEADKLTKAATADRERAKQIATRAKADPSVFSELAKELGLSEEELDAMSDARVNARIAKALREADEAKDPNAKAAREQQEELARLRKADKENTDRLAEQDQQQRMQRTEGLVIQTLDAIGPAARNVDAAQQVVWTLRALVNQKEAELGRPLESIQELGNSVSPAALSKAVLENWSGSVARYFEAHPEAPLPESVLKRAEALLAKRAAERPKHPAEGGGGTSAKGGRKPEDNGIPKATSVLQRLLR